MSTDPLREACDLLNEWLTTRDWMNGMAPIPLDIAKESMLQ